MAQFRIKIAGQVFSVSSLFESTRDYCRRYLTDEAADASITVTPEDLLREQAQLREEALREGMRVRIFTDPFLERTAIQNKVADHLLRRDTLLLHGSAVAVDGEGYLFTANCGTGKSTHTRFWREVFGSRAVMVNDDKPFVQLRPEGIFLWGAPWSGKHGLDTNITVPLKGICILHRGSENRILRISGQEALPMLLHQSNPPADGDWLPHYRQLVAHLAEQAPLWEMHCTKSPDAAETAYAAMSCPNGKKE